MKLLLASSSPRRASLLRQAGYHFEITSTSVEEKTDPALSPDQQVLHLAESKRDSIGPFDADIIVLAADTLVCLGGRLLGKPGTPENAANMLRLLSGRTHRVYTGVAVRRGSQALRVAEMTEVTFRSISEPEIQWYISTGEPLDKAGGYGIQGAGAVFIEGIRGSYTNVVGLPLCTTSKLLSAAGYQLWEENT